MKKISIFVAMLMILFSFTVFDIKSYNVKADLPVGKNYFDFSRVVKLTGSSNSYYTFEAFKAKADTQYTLVMSKAFLKDLYDDIETEEFEVSVTNSDYPIPILYSKDVQNERVYVEFVTVDEIISIERLLIPKNNLIPNYEIILYEGLYADFFGFEPYIALDDQVKYYGNLKVNYDQLLSTETISSYIGAVGPSSEVVNLNLKSDTYSTSNKRPGTYEMVYEAEFNHIKKQYFLSVIVEDLTAPSITISAPIEVPLAQKVDINTIKSYILVSDNVDSMSHNNLVIKADTYSAATTVGTYSITVEATDSSSNKTTKSFDIKLIDQKGPVFNGPDELYIYVTDSPLTQAKIKSFFGIVDDVALNESSFQFTFDAYLQTTTAGVYKMTMSVADMAGNVTLKDVYIHVIENRGPQFNVNAEYIITVGPTEIKSETDIITYLSMALKDGGINATNIKVEHNEYELRAQTKGQYYVYLNYEVDDETYQTRVLIDVVGEKQFHFNPLYLLAILPVGALVGIIIYRKRKIKI